MDSEPDIYVAALRYSLKPNDQVTYINPPPIEFDTEVAHLKLAEGQLTCDMKIHFPTVDQARTAIEPILKAWEVDAALQSNQGGLRFKFDGADVIDRSPVPDGVNRGHAHLVLGAVSLAATGTVSVHAAHAEYPKPPSDFRLNPDAESIFLRYQGYLAGREPLLSMGYFCLTVLEASAGGKLAAATKYRIATSVLSTMGVLTTKRGDRSIARKATSGPTRPLTGSENAWIEAAVKVLIRRLGDTRDSATRPLITMADPSLPTL